MVFLSNIRVTYSGLIGLIIGISTIFTGMIFMLIITRTLSQNDFGTWGVISGILPFVIIFEQIIPYWVRREIARGINSAKTAILSSGFLSSSGILIFYIVSLILSQNSDIDQNILLFGIILVPAIFLNRILNAINLGWKPELTSYAQLVLSLSQIPLAFVLILILKLELLGLILTIFLATLVSISFQIYFARKKLKNTFQFKFLKQWLKVFWIPTYPTLILLISKSDILIFTLITNSVLGISFWIAALVITAPISQVGLVSRSVYSKLLSTKSVDVGDNLTLVFYFALPFTSLAIVFSRPALFALNPLYEFVFLLVVILSIRVFFNTLNDILESYILGTERVDFDKNSVFKDFISSKFFSIPSIRFIQYTIYIILLIVGLIILTSQNASEYSLLIYWASIATITTLPTTVYLYIQTRKNLHLELDIKSIAKYLITCIFVFSIVFYFSETYLVYDENLMEFLPGFLLYLPIGIISYLVITYFIDKRIKFLVHAIINEIKISK